MMWPRRNRVCWRSPFRNDIAPRSIGRLRRVSCRDCIGLRQSPAGPRPPREILLLCTRPVTFLDQHPSQKIVSFRVVGIYTQGLLQDLPRTFDISHQQIHTSEIRKNGRVRRRRRSSLFQYLGRPRQLTCGNQCASQLFERRTEVVLAPKRFFIPMNRLIVVTFLGIGIAKTHVKFRLGGLVFLEVLLQAGNSRFQIRSVVDLGNIHIQLIFRRWIDFRGVIKSYLAMVIFLGFLERLGRVTSRLIPLNVVVRHHCVHDVLRSPLGHMALDTRAAPRGHFRLMRACVTIPAHGRVMLSGLLSARNRVRIVAGGARHLAALKARRFSQPVGGMRDLELIVMTAARRVIEEQDGIAEGFPRPVGKRPLRITKELTRQ